MQTLRSGIDLVEIARFEQLNPAIRARFFKRVFTPYELSECQEHLPTLAGRFAVKEAVAKALGCGIGPVRWQEIEVGRGELGQPVLKLHGNARRIADDQGLVIWSISISHAREHAVAVAVALSECAG
jgi:holo-[acyl-carrier protein] synthase